MTTGVAFLFPGQAPLKPRSGVELMDASPPTRALVELASDLCGVDLGRLLRRGGRDLSRTRCLQPAVTALSLGAMTELQNLGITPDAVAGLSAGEIAAWCAAGCITPEQAIAISVERGRLMQREADRTRGSMCMMTDTRHDAGELAVESGREHGFVVVANRPSPGEWLLSGETDAIRHIERHFQTRRLPTEGAWHSPAMAGAHEEFRALVRGVAVGAPRASFIANRTGDRVDPATIPDHLADQLTLPVQWIDSMQTLDRLGTRHFVSAGPGRMLRLFLQRTLERPSVFVVQDVPDARAVRDAISVAVDRPRAATRGIAR